VPMCVLQSLSNTAAPRIGLQEIGQFFRDGLPSPRWPKLQSLQGSARDTFHGDKVVVLDAMHAGSDWSLKVNRDGVKVWQRTLPGCPYAEIRGNALLRASPNAVVALMRQSDEETIRQYNPTYESGYDLETLDADTKVTYGAAKRFFPFKPRDTVTRIAFRRFPAGSIDSVGGSALVLRAIEHRAMPPRRGFVRARVIRGVTLIQPVRRQPGMTNFTFTQQVDAGGIIPPWMINRVIAIEAVSFMQRVGQAARTSRRGRRA